MESTGIGDQIAGKNACPKCLPPGKPHSFFTVFYNNIKLKITWLFLIRFIQQGKIKLDIIFIQYRNDIVIKFILYLLNNFFKCLL